MQAKHKLEIEQKKKKEINIYFFYRLSQKNKQEKKKKKGDWQRYIEREITKRCHDKIDRQMIESY